MLLSMKVGWFRLLQNNTIGQQMEIHQLSSYLEGDTIPCCYCRNMQNLIAANPKLTMGLKGILEYNAKQEVDQFPHNKMISQFPALALPASCWCCIDRKSPTHFLLASSNRTKVEGCSQHDTNRTWTVKEHCKWRQLSHLHDGGIGELWI